MSDATTTKRQRKPATKPAAPHPNKEFLEFVASVVDGDLITIDAESITVDRGRNFSRYYAPDDKRTKELAKSIERNGQIQEVVVRPHDGGLELVVGYRRVAAIAMIPATRRPQVRARVETLTNKDAALRNIAENRDREDQSPIDVAYSLKSMIAMGVTRADIAETMRRTNAWITLRLSLLKLHEDIMAQVHNGQVSVSAGVELAKLPKAKQLVALMTDAIAPVHEGHPSPEGDKAKGEPAKESNGKAPTATQAIRTKARKARDKSDAVTVASFRTWLNDLHSMPGHGRFEGQLAFSLLSYLSGDDEDGGNLYDLFAVVEKFIPDSFDAALKEAGIATWTDARSLGSITLNPDPPRRAKQRRRVGKGNATAPAPKKRRRVTPK